MAQSSVKKFHIFRQNVNVIGGGLVLHANRLLEPNFKQSYQSNQHESILVELILPDLIRNEAENKVDKPKFVLGMAREDANGHEFYKYLLSVIEKLKGTLSKLQRLKGTRNDFVLSFIPADCDFLLIVQFNSKAVEKFQSSIIGVCDHVIHPLFQKQGFIICKSGKIFKSGIIEIDSKIVVSKLAILCEFHKFGYIKITN